MKFRLYLKSFNKENLLLTGLNLKKILDINKYVTSSLVILPHRTRKFCVIRSPHIDKDSREQLEITLYKSFFNIEVSQYNSLEEILKFTINPGVIANLHFLSF